MIEMNNNTPVRTRMAPSPTGEYHVGHIATLLKNYAFAKKNGGQFVLRIEDTDRERYVDGAIERILDVIRDYGLGWDEGPDVGGPHAPYIQSERLELYAQKAKELVEMGKAYYCFCSKERLEIIRDHQRESKQPPRYDRHCLTLTKEEVDQRLAAGESSVIRLRVPDDETVTFSDLIRGEISIQSNEVDDQVLFKSDGFPTYHLAVVVDDHLMKITHILRGEEWISSTPKHILLYRSFGWESPIYAHVPVFLNPDGQGKMSKRKGTVAARAFLDEGYLPEAMLNFFMILGWTPEDQREIMTLEEYIQEFDPKDISAKSVVFDLQKLRWMNGMYIRKLTPEELIERTRPFWPTDFPENKADQILPLIHERIEVLSELEELTSFFYREPEIDLALLIKKADKQVVAGQLAETITSLQNVGEWSLEALEISLRGLQEKHDWKKSQYFMMLRVASTGRTVSPPLFETMMAIGKETTLARLAKAHDLVA